MHIHRPYIFCLICFHVGYLMGAETHSLSAAVRGGVADTTSHPVPVLVGVLSEGAEMHFCIGFLEGGRPINQTWAKIGQKARGLELKLYDTSDDVLLAQYDDRHVYRLRLNEANVKNSKAATIQDEAKKYLQDQLGNLRRGLDEMPVRGNIAIVLDDDLSADERKRYDFARAQAAKKGSILAVVKIDGRIKTIEKRAASNSLPDFVKGNLTLEDRAEYDMTDLLLTAEYMEAARASRRTKPVPNRPEDPK